MVNLQPMSAERYAFWHKNIWKLYFDELVQAGFSESYAKENCNQGIENSMPGGKLAPNNFAFEIVHEEKSVGVVWLVKQDDEWSIYDIDIDETHRGKGLGRKTMKAIEQYVADQNGTAINLSVFGFNHIARKLYETEGYETVRIQMKKKLK